jgi:hypothetical protein
MKNNSLAPTRPHHSPPTGATVRTHSPLGVSLPVRERPRGRLCVPSRKAAKRKNIKGGEWIKVKP